MTTPAPLPDDELDDRAAIAFLECWLADRARGVEHGLTHYLGNQPPRLQARIAREWLSIADPLASPAEPVMVRRGAGDRIGPYRLVRELGRGGQGIVYLAIDEALHRQVALKVLAEPLPALATAAELRLQREAEALGRLEHPGLVRVYATGRDGDTSWIAMRFVAGGSLQQWLADRTAQQKPPRAREELRRCATWIARAARALAAAHRAGVLHRDIKPANLLLDAGEQPVLVDFGLAHATAAATPTVARPGDLFGTLAYLAPERLLGAPADERGDVHALGTVLFELLTLQRPFAAATTAQELRAIATAPSPDPRTGNDTVPADLALVTTTALAREPERRYASADAFAEDLERWLDGRPIAARPQRSWQRLGSWARRHRALATSLATSLALLLTGLLTTAWQWFAAEQALADVRRLADLKAARDLLARADQLWPARPERQPAMRAWLDAAETLLSHAAEHERQLALLPPAGTDATADWQREQLAALQGLRQDLRDRSNLVATRSAAATAASTALQTHAADWQAAAQRALADPRLHGLRLTPQFGLVPLGPDPASGLEEFAHLASGSVPRRGADGRLVPDESDGVVLVLIPGGVAVLGAERRSPANDRPHNLDPEAPDGSGPCQTVALRPFLIGKYELTQAQWRRHTGSNPATYFPGGPIGEVTTFAHPIESIPWNDAERVLRELDLGLPSEAQWEWAYRAFSRSVFPHGDDERQLQGRENLADATAQRRPGIAWPVAAWLDDGHLVHAPVGGRKANAFGLHDLGGNVREWCADSWEDYVDCPPRPDDGLRMGAHDRYRVVRGGCFASLPADARSAARGGNERTAAGPMAGVRACRPLDR